MATKRKKKEDIEVKQPEKVAPRKKRFKTEKYEVIAPWQVGSKLYKKGDTIELTKEAYKFYKEKKVR